MTRAKVNIKRTIAASQLNLEAFLNPTKDSISRRGSSFKRFTSSAGEDDMAEELEDAYELYEQESNYMNFDLLQEEIKTIWQFMNQNNN